MSDFVTAVCSLFRAYPYAAIGATALVLLLLSSMIGALLSLFAKKGEEPPIRVKGGTGKSGSIQETGVHLCLIGTEFPLLLGTWTKVKRAAAGVALGATSPYLWKVADGKRASLGIAIRISQPMPAVPERCIPVYQKVRSAVFAFTLPNHTVISNFLIVTFDSRSTKTTADMPHDNPKQDKRDLGCGRHGYISAVEITLENGAVHPFTFAQGEFREAILF